jgi:GNAT superfamily N-acetyltransferase
MMVPPPRHSRFVEPPPFPLAGENVEANRFAPLELRTHGGREIRLAVRPVCADDGGALQAYVRGLCVQSRYNRFLGAVNELSAPELTRTLAANGRDMLTLLLVSTQEDRETIVGEARAALSCPDRAGEFSLSIADDWQGLGVGSALLEEVERKAAGDGIEWLFGDTLRTNAGMIGLARRYGYRLGPGLEPRLLRMEKRLDAALDLPCRKWAEFDRGMVPGADRAA